MAVTVKTTDYQKFGKCVAISNGEAEVFVTVDMGPRIIRCGFVGGVNMMFSDDTFEVITTHPSMETHYYKGAKWVNFGGHRLWASPEKMPNTYYPDNNPVEYTLLENGAIFTQEPQTQNGVQMQMQVTMEEYGRIEVRHFIKNISDAEKTLSVWALSVLNQGGLEIIPNNTLDTYLLPNRRIVAWPYTNLADHRVHWGEKYITLKQDPSAQANFKLGLDNHAGTALYVLEDTVFVNQYTHDQNAVYDDFGVSFETYTSKDILEMETLSPIQTLKPGETAEHTEHWSLYKTSKMPDGKNEAEVERFVQQYL